MATQSDATFPALRVRLTQDMQPFGIASSLVNKLGGMAEVFGVDAHRSPTASVSMLVVGPGPM